MADTSEQTDPLARLDDRLRRAAWSGLVSTIGRLAEVVRRHPKSSLVLGAVLAVLGTLAPDLFMAIPWGVRKGLGWCLFGTGLLIALARILEIRDTDDPPPGDPAPARGFARCLPYLLAAACLVLAWPLLERPRNLGFGDWDLFLGKHEAARRTILDYGEFPWWDPWTRGGFPLAANPQCGVISVQMPFILLFGTTIGMRIATVICFLLAAEGARRLARLWIGDPWGSFAAGLIYGLNGAVLVAAVAAYHVSMCYPALPWMLYHLARLGKRPVDAVGLGFWTAFSVLNGIQYFTVYTALIAGVVWLRALRAREGRLRFLNQTVLAIGVFLLLAGWRVATTGLVYRDFPRAYPSSFRSTLDMVPGLLFGRHLAEVLKRQSLPEFWESVRYLGPIVPSLALASLVRGWRWWHTLILLTLWLSAGATEWYQPTYWLSHWPIFSTMHVITRWHFMSMLGVGLAAGSTIGWIRSIGKPWWNGLAFVAIAAVAADYVSYGFEVLPVAFSVAADESHFPGPPLPTGEIVQVETCEGFPAISRGYGVIHGFEPLMGYDRDAPTARLWRGHPDYAGEFATDEGEVRPRHWTPNRIELEVRPGQEVTINQNPGSWWLVNGSRPFAADRCAEMRRPYVVRADDRGRVVLQIRPRGLGAGLWLHAAGAAIIAVFAAVGWLGRAGVRAR
ncbi:hypothetical protein [Aquisphaera insulae]|uniref:hypothetical protein n=1 Tax=Aquisphaera insulae TaxID=2712864 RepID=UPI0013EAE986|nr:hypothetical protein [Aquisphaera insulae]